MRSADPVEKDNYWYKNGVIYQVHIKAFKDGNGDGMGDFKGLTEKLDYIKSLGVSIIWILPFYPSPLKDDGYDIADYLNINPDYGSIDDFKKLIKEAHKLGIKIITELVLNHTSDQHEWFKKARKSPPGSPERNFYVWNDTPDKYSEARIIFSDFETSNWTWDPVARSYYWHRFYSHQPDLNFDNPEVHKMLFKVLDFWFDTGIDGMRLDAVPYLYEREGTNCENLPETHQFLKKLNAYVQKKYNGKMLLAEANQWPEDAVSYFGNGDECQMAFHFPVMPRMYMAIQMENRFPIIDIIEQTPPIPDNCQWAMFLRNHDELTLEMVTDEERDYMYRFFAKDKKARINLGIRRRLAPLIENNRRKIELLNILLFSFPGTPIIYYGDEIGMGDNYYLGDRHGVRTPMQWSPDRNAGFSSGNPQSLYLPVIIDPEYHYESVNVEVQQRNRNSLLWWMRRAINVRNSYPSFGRGTIEFLSPDNSKVLAFIREYENEKILVVANLSRSSQVVELDLSRFKNYKPVEMFSKNIFPPIGDLYYMLTLAAYDYYWFLLQETDIPVRKEKRDIPELTAAKKWTDIFEKDNAEFLEEKILPGYFDEFRIIDKTKIQFLQISEVIPVVAEKIYLLIIRIEFIDKPPEVYYLFAGIRSFGENEDGLDQRERIASVTADGRRLLLVNSFYNEELRKILVRTILLKKSFNGSKGDLKIFLNKRFKTIEKDKEENYPVRIFLEDNYTISFHINENFIIKFYKKLEEGKVPDEEILSFLQEKTGYCNIAFLTGTVKYFQPGCEEMTFAIINEYVRNEGDALELFSDAFLNYLEHISVMTEADRDIHISFLFDDNFRRSDFEEHTETFYADMAGLLGKRTSELHLALSSNDEDPSFRPDPVTIFYQRAFYQSMRTLIKNTFRSLKTKNSDVVKKYENIIAEILKSEQSLLTFVDKILHMKVNAAKIRIHGNYNLKQILFTGKDFVLTNFQGQYASPISDRKLKRFPLRDLASLIWSIHTMAYQKLEDQSIFEFISSENAGRYANQWWFSMSRLIISNYYDVLFSHKEEAILPAEREKFNYLLMIYLLEKVLTDLSFGLSNQADWTVVKLKGLQQLIEHTGHLK